MTPNISTKINLLKLLLADKENFKKVMIFTETKKNADRIVERLADHWKGELSVIHSNKAQNTRLKALRSFKEGRPVLWWPLTWQLAVLTCRM